MTNSNMLENLKYIFTGNVLDASPRFLNDDLRLKQKMRNKT